MEVSEVRCGCLGGPDLYAMHDERSMRIEKILPSSVIFFRYLAVISMEYKNALNSEIKPRSGPKINFLIDSP